MATLFGCVAYAGGLLDRLYWFGYDLHCRHCSTIQADPRIVLIDVDDQSLRAIPWPWPRREHARLVNTLRELGAKSIVLDFIFAEPSKPRHSITGYIAEDDADSELPVYGDPASEPLIYDDNELGEAMLAAGNVYLPMYGRLNAALPDSDAEIAARSFLRDNPTASFRQFFTAVRPSENYDARTAARAKLLDAFSRARAAQVAARSQTTCSVLAPHISRTIFPIEALVKAAKAIGFAAFDRGQTGGVLRMLPPVVQADEQGFMQLGFIVGLDAAGLSHDAWVDRPHLVVLSPGPDQRLAYLMNAGADPGGPSPQDVPIFWHVPPHRDQWQESFTHFPAAYLMEIAANRAAVEENNRRVLIAKEELVRLRHADTKQSYSRYVDLVKECNALARTQSENTPSDSRLQILNNQIAVIEAEARQWLTRAWQLWDSTTPQTESERKERDTIKRLYDALHDDAMRTRMATINQRIQKDIDARLDELRPKIAGKLCFVGYTASAVADLVTTPVYSAMPGVMAHANVANMVLQNRFLHPAPAWINGLLLALCGLCVTFLSIARGWRLGLLGSIGVAFGVITLGAILFLRRDYHLASSIGAAQAGFVWASVTAYRQGFEERARRRLHAALAQYTSPQIAARILERVSTGNLAPRSATVTCFFCDLTGFTSLSERLGPQRTRDILNPYLETVSRILVSHGAIVNKFMGDGVFAFFNAPILPCCNHTESACRAALEIASAFQNRDRAAHQYRDGKGVGSADSDQGIEGSGKRDEIDNRQSPIANLRVRIGLATGEAFVGDYGSETKLDYTCIGDVPNLASRLEQLNKKLGTTILLDAATRAACGDRFSFHEIGNVEIEGREQSATVCELLQQKGEPQISQITTD